jgi:DeoD family purine-nucleoside phosphorylase
MRRSLKSRAVSDSATAPPHAIHLHPTAPLAERVLLPGDPGRALALAQSLLKQPLMFNHNRGLWGYTGAAADGEPLTIQSTGMGGPSAAIVAWELADLGARRLLRVGTCGALSPLLGLGELVIVTSALAADGTSRALGADGHVPGDEGLERALVGAAPAAHSGSVVSTDLFYDPRAGLEEEWRASGALAVEMECATLFAVAARRGLAAGCLLTVTDLVHAPARTRIEADSLEDAARSMGSAAARALGA